MTAAARTRIGPRSRLALVVVGLAGVAAVGGYVFGGIGEPGEGPLEGLGSGVTITAEPSGKPMYFTLDGCTEAGGVQLRITQVETIGAWGPDEATWLVGWPHTLHDIGLGPGPAPRDVFTPVGKDPGGATSDCGPEGFRPTLAAEFPHADTADVGFDRIRVHYTADGKSYVREVDVSLGVCGQRATRTRC